MKDILFIQKKLIEDLSLPSNFEKKTAAVFLNTLVTTKGFTPHFTKFYSTFMETVCGLAGHEKERIVVTAPGFCTQIVVPVAGSNASARPRPFEA